MFGSDCNIVVNAEPIDNVSETRMMPWRTNNSESIVPLSTHDIISSRNNPSHSQIRSVAGVLIDISIKNKDVGFIEIFGPQVMNIVNVLFRVTIFYDLLRSRLDSRNESNVGMG